MYISCSFSVHEQEIVLLTRHSLPFFSTLCVWQFFSLFFNLPVFAGVSLMSCFTLLIFLLVLLLSRSCPSCNLSLIKSYRLDFISKAKGRRWVYCCFSLAYFSSFIAVMLLCPLLLLHSHKERETIDDDDDEKEEENESPGYFFCSQRIRLSLNVVLSIALLFKSSIKPWKILGT